MIDRNRARPAKLAIVVPCYNEEMVLIESAGLLANALEDVIAKGKIAADSFICFVDDGSRDRTWEYITNFNKKSKMFRGIKLSRNFGHQEAILAGMLSLKGKVDCIITIDADLQDDLLVLEQFINKYNDGYELVYGVKRKREADNNLKKATALLFYRIMRLMGVKIIYNHADFRFIGKKALSYLDNFTEVNLFLRGIFPLIGFRTTIIEYDIKERTKGKSKYKFFDMLSLAVNGITSFSIIPLRIITFVGFIIFFLSSSIIIWILIAVFHGHSVPGWASIVLPIYFLGGVQLMFLGLIGEYLGKVFLEVKRRPRFIVENEI